MTAVNGSVMLTDVAGAAVVHSTNGEVKVTLRQVTPQKPMSFTSFNGDVDVTLPPNTKANLKMRTDHGEVLTDFDVQIQQRPTSATSSPGAGFVFPPVAPFPRFLRFLLRHPAQIQVSARPSASGRQPSANARQPNAHARRAAEGAARASNWTAQSTVWSTAEGPSSSSARSTGTFICARANDRPNHSPPMSVY